MSPSIVAAQDIISNAGNLSEALFMAIESLEISMTEKSAVEALCDEIQTKLKEAGEILETVKSTKTLPYH